MNTRRAVKPVGRKAASAFTLAEVMISIAVATISIGGIVVGFNVAARRAEWSACSTAAQLMAMRGLEQTRAAKWDPLGYPPVDDLVGGNYSNAVAGLNIPLSNTNAVYATNRTSIILVSTNPLLKMVRVDCVWSLLSRGPFTNTVITYRAPDQ
jgi:type II secretory pathway pseudopilin PulG